MLGVKSSMGMYNVTNNEMIDSNSIRRQRMRQQRLKNDVIKLRQALPVYTLEEIREFQMPILEAKLMNLEEKNFKFAADLIRKLVDFQNEMINKTKISNKNFVQPQLRFCKLELNNLSNELMKAETFEQNDDHHNQIKTLLKLAIHYAFGHHDWMWLGEQLLLTTIKIATSCNAKEEALSRFVYGKYLAEERKETERALEYLEQASTLSKKNTFLTVFEYFPDIKEQLVIVINRLMYECNMKMADELKSINAVRATEFTVWARKKACKACYNEGIFNAYLLKASCEIRLNQWTTAINTLKNAVRTAKTKMKSQRHICMSMLELAKAYMATGSDRESLYLLNEVEHLAKQNNLIYYEGLSLKLIGEYFLSIGYIYTAACYIKKALVVFESIEEKDPTIQSEMEKIILFSAITTGLDLLPELMNLIINYDKFDERGVSNMKKLLDWKDHRKSFWKKKKHLSNPLFTQFANALQDIPKTPQMSMPSIETNKNIKAGTTSKNHHLFSDYSKILHEAKYFLIDDEDRLTGSLAQT